MMPPTSLACARMHPVRAADVAVDEERPLAAAEVGLLCSLCYNRLVWRLREAPTLLRHVRSLVVPDLGGGGSEAGPVSGTRERALPFSTSALEDSDELFAAIANEARVLADDLGIASASVPAAIRRAHERGVTIEAITTTATPADVYHGAYELCEWFAGMAQHAASRYGIEDVYDGIVPLIEKIDSRYPQEPRARRIIRQHARPCPVCDAESVLVTWAGVDPVVACSSCGFRVPITEEVLDGLADVPAGG